MYTSTDISLYNSNAHMINDSYIGEKIKSILFILPETRINLEFVLRKWSMVSNR